MNKILVDLLGRELYNKVSKVMNTEQDTVYLQKKGRRWIETKDSTHLRSIIALGAYGGSIAPGSYFGGYVWFQIHRSEDSRSLLLFEVPKTAWESALLIAITDKKLLYQISHKIKNPCIRLPHEALKELTRKR